MALLDLLNDSEAPTTGGRWWHDQTEAIWRIE
jgi:hypothetical protein